MVALNFQTPDLAMQLNQGKCEYNGNCGSVQSICNSLEMAYWQLSVGQVSSIERCLSSLSFSNKRCT